MKAILAAVLIVFGVQLIFASPAPEPLLNVLTNTLGSVVNLTTGLLSPAIGSIGGGGSGGLGGLGGLPGLGGSGGGAGGEGAAGGILPGR